MKSTTRERCGWYMQSASSDTEALDLLVVLSGGALWFADEARGDAALDG